MPWDARSRRVFLEIPDKSWCCYLAFDSFPCMEAKSSLFFLCSALAQTVLGLTPWPPVQQKSPLELCTSLPRSRRAPLAGPWQPALHPRVLTARWGCHGSGGHRAPGDRALLSHTPATTPWLEGGTLLPDPRTHPWPAASPHSLISITEAPSPGSGLHRGVWLCPLYRLGVIHPTPSPQTLPCLTDLFWSSLC